jgi:hypothetical protein
MPIHSLLENSAFSPEEIAELIVAYHAAVRDLQSANGADRATNETIASIVLEVAKTGEREADMIAEKVVARLRK